MSTRFDISSPRPKKDGGTYWVKIGTAFTSEKGTQLIFDALPLPDKEGRVVANLFPPRDKNGGGSFKASQQQSGGFDADLDDGVPF